jgi:hypothetical protein
MTLLSSAFSMGVTVCHYNGTQQIEGFQEQVLRKTSEHKGGWINRRMENIRHNLYSPPKIIRVISLRRMIWAGNVARMGEMRNSYIFVRKHKKETQTYIKGCIKEIIKKLIQG